MTSMKSKFATATFLATVAFFTGSSSAATIPAQEGKAYYGTDTCWSDHDGGVKNNCATSKWWVIPVTLNTGGNKTFKAFHSTGVSCYYWESDAAGNPNPLLTGSGILLSAAGTVVNTSVGFFAKVQCQVNAGRYVYGLDVAFP